MFKAGLVILALTVDLATSISCYMGTKMEYSSGCSSVNNGNTITKSDNVCEACYSYKAYFSFSNGCEYTQTVSHCMTEVEADMWDAGTMSCDTVETVTAATANAYPNIEMTLFECDGHCDSNLCNMDGGGSDSAAGPLPTPLYLACLSSFALGLLLYLL